jgi:hypothetical protein
VFATTLGIAWGVLWQAGLYDVRDLRYCVLAGFASAAALGVAALVHRFVFRRMRTVLVGDETEVRRLATAWPDDGGPIMVGSCAWRDDGNADHVDEAVSRLGPAVMALVLRQGAREVVVANEGSLTPTKRRELAARLYRAGVRFRVANAAKSRA